jgi:quercetin dioxygenase-like cupin family protein
MMKQILSVVALTLAFTSLALGQAAQKQDMLAGQNGEITLYPTTEIQWKDGPKSLQPGVMMAVLEGDPTKEGFFTIRFRFPDGFKVQPHWHPRVEHVTVISGTLNIGMGDKFDQTATRPMPVGTFGFWPPGMKHFAWVSGETVIQLHGMGPWVITYLNPSDDPRNAKK